MRALLNVGGGNKGIPIPSHFEGWRHDLLDIDPKGNPDVLADARELIALPGGIYDAIYCSHNLEHYFHHDMESVVKGFHHMLKPDGFAHIIVPDLIALMQHAVEKQLDLDDNLYESSAGPINLRDVVYGYQREIRESGNDFFVHKNGFSVQSLRSLMVRNGFPIGGIGQLPGWQICGYFFKQEPSDDVRKLLGVLRG